MIEKIQRLLAEVENLKAQNAEELYPYVRSMVFKHFCKTPRYGKY